MKKGKPTLDRALSLSLSLSSCSITFLRLASIRFLKKRRVRRSVVGINLVKREKHNI